jgi:AraC-like DNA-binding protein
MVQGMHLSRSHFPGGRLPGGLNAPEVPGRMSYLPVMIVASLPRSNAVRRLSRARDRLCADLARKLPLGDVAREAAFSPGQFIRAFSAVFGQTPHQVRIDARLDLAKRLLIADSMPVTEVSAAAGFASLGTFSYEFARRVGSAPSSYRRAARALVQVPGTLPLKLYPGCFSLMAWLPADAFKRNF